MVSARHGKQTVAQGIHGIVAFEYANAAARLAAGPFTTEDLYKVAIQLDNNSLWVLTSNSPIVWTVSSATGGTQDLASVLSLGNDADGYKIVNLLDPTNPQDAATKNYVDTHSGGGSQTLKQTLALGNVTDGYNIVVSAGNVITITNAPTAPTDGVNKAYVDGYIGTQALLFIRRDGTVAFTGDQSLGNHKLTNVTNPTLPQDAATKAYVDGYSFPAFSLATTLGVGNTTTGHNIIISSGDHITITDAPLNPTDAANKAYVDGYIGNQSLLFIRKDGSVDFTADQSMGSHKLTNVTNPTLPQDAATKAYIDGYVFPAFSLATTLGVGNTTSAHNIIVSSGDHITITDAPVNPTDAVNKNYVDGYFTSTGLFIRVDGTSTVSANIPFNNHKLTGVTDPTLPQDAATKAYVDGYNFSGAVTLAGDVSGPAGSNVINTHAVSYNKIQIVGAGSRLLGRGASGSGDVQEIILGSNLSMSGNTLNATGGGGGGGTQNLFVTLSLGNSTDGYDIIVTTGDVITLIDAPVNPTDAVNKAYVDAQTSPTPDLATVLAVGNDADGYKIINLANPTLPQDAATKAYVDGYSGGLTPTQHAALRQLIHLADGGGPFETFASNAYREITGDVFPSSIIWYTDNTKVDKIISKEYTYIGAFPDTITWKVFDVDGSTVLATVTDTLTYSSAFETSRVRTIV